MTRRVLLFLLMLGVFNGAAAHRLLAHDGHEHKILGTVTMAAADHVMVKDKDGKDVTVQVTKATKVKSKPAMKVEEIKVGTRVLIVATMEKDKSLKAKTIEVGVAPAPTK